VGTLVGAQRPAPSCAPMAGAGHAAVDVVWLRAHWRYSGGKAPRAAAGSGERGLRAGEVDQLARGLSALEPSRRPKSCAGALSGGETGGRRPLARGLPGPSSATNSAATCGDSPVTRRSATAAARASVLDPPRPCPVFRQQAVPPTRHEVITRYRRVTARRFQLASVTLRPLRQGQCLDRICAGGPASLPFNSRHGSCRQLVAPGGGHGRLRIPLHQTRHERGVSPDRHGWCGGSVPDLWCGRGAGLHGPSALARVAGTPGADRPHGAHAR
jgi:hypothetical protein